MVQEGPSPSGTPKVPSVEVLVGRPLKSPLKSQQNPILSKIRSFSFKNYLKNYSVKNSFQQHHAVFA